MKHSTAMLRIVTTIFILSTAALAAEDLPVRSVLLYPDRAQITRKDNVKLVAGKNRLIIANVSPNLLPDTLRASCAPDCSIVEVSSRLDRFSETVRPRIQTLEKKFAAVKEKRDTVSATIQRNQFVLNFVNQLSTAASRVIGEETMRPADSGRWTKAAQFIQNERTARRSLIQKQEEQGRKIDLELAAIQKELDMARAEGEKTARTVEVRLTSSRAQSAEVQVGYNIRGASWSISYGALLAKDGSVEIEMFGNAVQSTGEDWKNVSLGFSTANTERGLERPRVRPIRLRVIEKSTAQSYKLEDRATGNVDATESQPAEAEETGGQTDIETGGTALIFRVPEPQTVESSNRSKKVPLARFVLKPMETYYRVVPSISESAVLAVKLKNDRVFPLLAGPVDLFRGGRFAGKTTLHYVAGTSEFTLGFAEDRNIVVTRTVNRNRGTAGILGGGKLWTREIRFETENRGNTPADIRIFESIPVSELEEVKISVTESGGFAEEKKGSGIYSKRLTLTPGSKGSAMITYTVRTPEDFPDNLIDR